MKSLFNLRTIVFVFSVILFTGCSGITETTLPDANDSTINSTSTEVLHQDVPDFINSDETNEPTIEPSEDRYIDRE